MSKARCKGCGAVLQQDHADQVGYTPDLNRPYCQACFRLSHYGEVKSHVHPEEIPTLKPKSLALMVCSVMALDMLFFYPLHRYAPNVTYTYIINQVDLLPESTNLELFLKRIIKRAQSMHIPYEDIILMSAKHKEDIKHLKEYIASFHVSDVYLLGVQNAGKTTLYKALVHDKEALAMNKAGLTQETLSAKLSSKQTIHDMPGLYQEGYLHQLFTYDTYKRLLVDKRLRPVIYQLKVNQAILIEGLVSVSVDKNCSVVCYMNRHIQTHRTQRERTHTLFKEQTLPDRIYAKAYETRTFQLPSGKQQITFADFGFVHIDGPGRITVTYPKGIHISLSEALFS